MNKTHLWSEDQPCKIISLVTNPKFNILLTHHSYSSQTTLRWLGNNINNIISWNICLLSSKSYPTQPGGGAAYRYLHIYKHICIFVHVYVRISLSQGCLWAPSQTTTTTIYPRRHEHSHNICSSAWKNQRTLSHFSNSSQHDVFCLRQQYLSGSSPITSIPPPR